MPKILYLGNFILPDKNAAAQRVLNNARAFRELGNDVLFISAGDKNEELTIDGFKTCFFRYTSKLDRIKYYLGISVKVVAKKYIKSADLIVAYNPPSLLLSYLLRKRKRFGYKLVGDITEWYEKSGLLSYDTKKRMEHLNFLCDGLIVVSPFLKSYYSNRVNCIEVPPLVNPEVPKNKSVLGSTNNFVFFGTISRQKERLDLIVRSFSAYEDANLFVLGCTANDFCNVYAFNKFEIAPNIHFLGRMTHRETIEFLCSCDYLVFLRDDNLTTRAGFSTKFAESLAFGIPVITNHSESTDLYVLEGKNGYFVNRLDETNLLEVIKKATKKVLRCFPDERFHIYTYLEHFKVFLSEVSGGE